VKKLLAIGSMALLCAALGVAMLASLALQRRLALWPRAVAAIVAGVIVGAPYLLYLHGALGRWALSGRVQAAVAEQAGQTGQAGQAGQAGQGGGSDAVREFVWGGNTEVLWRTLYALDAAGTQMASQYWGVPRRMAAPAGVAPAPPTPPEAPGPAPAAETRRAPGALATLARATIVVVPIWFLLLALVGLVRIRPSADAALWLAPMVLASVAPAVLAYAEPRVLLLLAPAACILAAGACELLRSVIEQRPGGARFGPLVTGAVALVLLYPSARDLARAWSQQTPLQQLATSRRIVGEYLGAHLAPDAAIVAWHPAVAIYARRDWRVLPYDSFDRIIYYARAQRAATVVFSRFEPTPLRDPPRAFTAVLLDDEGEATGPVTLNQVAVTPTLFVGRLAPMLQPAPPGRR